MSFWSQVGDILWFALTLVIFLGYLIALFSILGDLFRDQKLSGIAKAVWLLFLILVPFLTALIYLIARGGGMSTRAAQSAAHARAATDDYIRSVAEGTTSTVTEQIASAKGLHDDGAISTEEFEALKQTALKGIGI